MTNAIYPKFKKRCATTGGNLVDGTVKAQLISLADYAYSASHEFLSHIPSGARIGAAVALTGKTLSDTGVFDAENPDFSGLPGDVQKGALVLFVDTSVEGTSYLVEYIDAAPGLPIAASATSGTVAWSDGANKIFAL